MLPRIAFTSAFAALLAGIAVSGCGTEDATNSPIAADDRATTTRDTQVALSLIANDIAFAPASLALGSLDLDPATPGRQQWITTGPGRFLLDCTGDVLFIPAPGFVGETSTTYTVADSRGRVSVPGHITVTVEAN